MNKLLRYILILMLLTGFSFGANVSCKHPDELKGLLTAYSKDGTILEGFTYKELDDILDDALTCQTNAVKAKDNTEALTYALMIESIVIEQRDRQKNNDCTKVAKMEETWQK